MGKVRCSEDTEVGRLALGKLPRGWISPESGAGRRGHSGQTSAEGGESSQLELLPPTAKGLHRAGDRIYVRTIELATAGT